jgi:Tol biopolymer transport system component
VGWTPDGSAFLVASNERDARYFDIYRYDSATYERTLVYKNEHGDFPDDISGDGKWVAMPKLNSATIPTPTCGTPTQGR